MLCHCFRLAQSRHVGQLPSRVNSLGLHVCFDVPGMRHMLALLVWALTQCLCAIMCFCSADRQKAQAAFNHLKDILLNPSGKTLTTASFFIANMCCGMHLVGPDPAFQLHEWINIRACTARSCTSKGATAAIQMQATT